MNLQEYIYRRDKLLDQIHTKSVVLIFSIPRIKDIMDHKYLYYQNSDFWYFTGFNEPETILVLIKYDNTHNQSILFNSARDLTEERWFGRRLNKDTLRKKLGVDTIIDFNTIDKKLYQIFNKLDVIYHAQGIYSYADKIVFTALDKLRKGSRKNLIAPTTIIDWRPIVHEMRLFKSQEEVRMIRNACRISTLAHSRAMKRCHPGMFEYQLEGEFYHELYYHGVGNPFCKAIVGSGENSCILHYIKNESKMRDGDLVLIDAGCKYQGYCSDITRTFPVNGKFTSVQHAIYDIVLQSLEAALSLFCPNTSIQEVNEIVIRIIIKGLLNLGILQGNSIEELREKNAHHSFFMHELSHWIGLDVHDVGFYGINNSRKLKPGMVLTVEPGIYIMQNPSVPKKYHGIGIRIEDTIVITENGNENLTTSTSKTIKDIESIMKNVC